jgi:hypothetical protein
VSGNSERPDLTDPSRRVTVEDIRALVGPATPHFALQIRQRIERLIEQIPAGDPVRVEGERQIRHLERLAERGVTTGTVQEGELPLPSLALGDEDESTDATG